LFVHDTVMPLSPSILQRIQNNDPTLTKLSLSEISYGDEVFDTNDAYELAHALRTNTHLRCLNLAGHNIQASGILEILDALQGNTTLKVLNLNGNHNIFAHIKELLQRFKHTGLVWFDCGMATENTLDTTLTPSLDNLSDGRFLKIDKMEEGDVDSCLPLPDLVDELLQDYPLKHLDISGHIIDPNHYSQLTRLFQHPTLTSISLNRLSLGKEGAEHVIAGLENNQNITRLELSHNELTNDFITALANWSGAVTLKALNLSDNPDITEAVALMNVLKSSAIKNLSLANVKLDRNSISALHSFLKNNITCRNLNLAQLNLYDFVKPIFNQISKKQFVSFNIASCTYDKSTKGVGSKIADCLSNGMLKRLNIADILHEKDIDYFFKKLPDILSDNIVLEELILGNNSIPLHIEINFEQTLSNNNHVQFIDLKEFISYVKRLKRMESFLERNRTLKNPSKKIETLIATADALLDPLNIEQTAKIREQVINYYTEAEDLLRQWEMENVRIKTLHHILRLSAGMSFLKLGLPIKAWRRLHHLCNLDTEIWQKIAEAFFSRINLIPKGFKRGEYYFFICMLCIRAGMMDSAREIISNFLQKRDEDNHQLKEKTVTPEDLQQLAEENNQLGILKGVLDQSQQSDLTVATDYENMESKLFKKMNKQEEVYDEQDPALVSQEDKKELPKASLHP